MNILAVSGHRKEAIEAVAWAIDELKAKVPIWKKEYYEGEEAAGDGHCHNCEPKWKANPEFKQMKELVKD